MVSRSAVILTLTVVAVASPARAGPREEVLARTRAFLDAYAADRREVVERMAAPDLALYGSDLAEAPPQALAAMMAGDFKLWGTARVGAMRDVSVRVGGGLATVMFNAPFRAGDGPEVPVRFALVWRKSTDGWRLTQSSNTAVTTGSSAAALLHARAKDSNSAPSTW